MSAHMRLRGQDGFVREILWIALILVIIAVVVLDGMAIFSAHQSISDDTVRAADEALTEYTQSLNMASAQLAAEQYLQRSDLELLKFSASKGTNGPTKFTVTAKASAETYAFKYLGLIPPLKKWVQRTTHPVGSGSAE